MPPGIENSSDQNDNDIFEEVSGKPAKKAVQPKSEPETKQDDEEEDDFEEDTEDDADEDEDDEDDDEDDEEDDELDKDDEPETKKEATAKPKKNVQDMIKKVIVAKAAAAAKKDDELIPVIQDKEEGTKETDSQTPELNLIKPTAKLSPVLGFLEAEEGGVFIGRKKNIYEKYGMSAGLFVGRVQEDPFQQTNIYLDGLQPHAVFVCGSRGSGKSYMLGVLAEELALKNQNVGVVVIDPVGVFWSMKFPNKEEKELEALAKWDLLPQGLDNLKVFIPDGMKDKAPKETYDAVFAIQPGLLTAEDWCLTFKIERFSPTGLLLEKGLKKVKDGYETKDDNKKVKGKGMKYSILELIKCLEQDKELNSFERGYKPDSIRALTSRFDAADSWGVFNERGTPLSDISSENQLSIIDTSFLDEDVSALVVGIIARRILAARKLSTRRQSAQQFKKTDVAEFLEAEIPPTWLFIDEAHTLIPSGNIKTPASNALIEYVKQGRQPGCSIAFATQQPSAIDTRVLSQIDIIATHKLVFDDDIKAVYRRTPTVIPRSFKNAGFLKTLPVGVSLAGDRREETTRAFIMKTRPRMSQHEGRDSVTSEGQYELDDAQVQKLATEMAYSQLEREGSIEEKQLLAVIAKLNKKYGTSITTEDVMEMLEEKGAVVNPKTLAVILPGEKIKEDAIEEFSEEGDEGAEAADIEENDEDFDEDEFVEEEAKHVLGESTELLAFPTRVDEALAIKMFEKQRKKKFLGVVGKEERMEKVTLKFLPIFKMSFNYFNDKKSFNQGEAFVDSYTGEFIHFDDKKQQFMESSGLKDILDLNELEIKVLLAIGSQSVEEEALVKKVRESEMRVGRAVEKLIEMGAVKKHRAAESTFYSLKKLFDLPPTPLHPQMESLNKLAVSEVEAMELQREMFDKSQLSNGMKKLWNKLVVKKVKHVYLPFYECLLKNADGTSRMIWREAVMGKEMHFVK